MRLVVPSRVGSARRRALAAASGLVALALLTGCGTPAASSSPASSAPAPERTPLGDGVLRIGTLFPSTGSSAFLQPAQAAGVALAIADINAAGGVRGAPVELIARDSGDASTGMAETSFADLIANRADAVIGPSSSVLVQRLIPIATRERIPLISPAATFPGISAGSRFFARTIPAYGLQGIALGRELTKAAPAKIALLYVDDALGQAIAETLPPAVVDGGGSMALSAAIPSATTDPAPFVAQLVKAAPDMVVLATAYSSFDLTKAVIAQVVAAGYGGTRLWLTTQNTGDYSQAFPNGTLAAVNGIIDGFQPDDAFTARLTAVGGALASTRYAAEAYDATVLVALAALASGDDAGAPIADALQEVSRSGIACTSFADCAAVLSVGDPIDYDGVSGSIDLTDDGDVESGFFGLYSYDAENRFVYRRGVVVP